MLQVIPLTVKEAEEFLAKHERHYKAPAEPICAIGVGETLLYYQAVDTNPGPAPGPTTVIHGAAILGRRADGDAELTHIYVDGTSQGYSLLYGACWRALKALGYARTYL